jgi:hypothetical protein
VEQVRDFEHWQNDLLDLVHWLVKRKTRRNQPHLLEHFITHQSRQLMSVWSSRCSSNTISSVPKPNKTFTASLPNEIERPGASQQTKIETELVSAFMSYTEAKSILTHSTKTKQINYPSIDSKAYLMRSLKDFTVMSWTNNLQSLILIAVASSVDHPSLTGIDNECYEGRKAIMSWMLNN